MRVYLSLFNNISHTEHPSKSNIKSNKFGELLLVRYPPLQRIPEGPTTASWVPHPIPQGMCLCVVGPGLNIPRFCEVQRQPTNDWVQRIVDTILAMFCSSPPPAEGIFRQQCVSLQDGCSNSHFDFSDFIGRIHSIVLYYIRFLWAQRPPIPRMVLIIINLNYRKKHYNLDSNIIIH